MEKKKDWTSLAHHRLFMDSPAYKTFLDNLEPIVQSADLVHVDRLTELVLNHNGEGVLEMAVFYDVEDVFVEVSGM
ncbi:hypothetical protein SBOR_0060 [Sclerotinia borealis F-4128]|uniref:Uncharacterized protein n=1 Tax=Sclerotinia borealis (strain F-4128) TaxID=1432307 RepID=W9CXZ1_SCLBF|nr:hypothetical protein SBOR_0060 [Sclerotinia borealis F-4128]